MANTKIKRHLNTLLILLSAFLLLSTSASAGEPLIWETGSRAEILRGDARGISITDTGAFMLAPRFTQMFDTQQSFVWSSAVDSAGNVYLGTGHDGRIFRVTASGSGSLLYDAAELDVTALVVGRDGAVYAGTSPDGKVYRISTDGRAEVYFDPADKYIWSLAVMADGSLAVGTGDNGKLYRVRASGAKPEDALLVDTNETHVISLAVNSRGDLFAGTDPGGLVLRISPEGKAFALFDSSLREIHALAPAPDGSVYALALSEAASSARPAGVTTGAASGADSGGTVTTSVTITGVEDASAAASSRSRNDLSNARSAVFRLLPDGGTDVLWSSQTVTAFAVAPAPEGGSVLIGTSDKGRIYSVTDNGRDTLLLQSTEGQVSSLITRGREVFAASSNQGKLYSFSTEPVSEGTFESAVRDAKLVSSWGRIWWQGQGNVELQTRTGNSERPDMTWSDWSAPYTDPRGAQVTSPRARYIQWRARLRSTGATGATLARLEDVSIAYLPRNVAPEVLSITVLPVGVGLQQAVQIQADPNIEASGLDPSIFGPVATVPPRRLYQRGARSLQWTAEDRNGDTLEYAIYYRSLGESSFRLLKDKLRENFYTVDSAALADGRYIFRVVVSDAPENPGGQALTGERISEPVDIDNTPPVVRSSGTAQVTGDNVRVLFTVEDATGRLKRADVSINGGPWRAVSPEDGIADSARESYTLDLQIEGSGEHTVSLRAFDSSGNVGSARVTVRK
ncbi:MAG TPA: hypothetical protein VJS44_11435 [Pyrinomonadaceae bacterium]|nr:hypothetical protein [Pyrinomonadaceae bacterium]